MSFLLSVDMGLKTGLALFGRDGRLIWYRSQNYASGRRLKSAVHGIFKEQSDVSILVIEEANRKNIKFFQIDADAWREKFLYKREQRSGKQAKQNAQVIAKKVIEWSGAKRPAALRHDAAEAILAGLWGVLEAGWLKAVPKEIR